MALFRSHCRRLEPTKLGPNLCLAQGHSNTDAEALEFFFPPLSCNAAGRDTTRPCSGPAAPSLLWIVRYLCSHSGPAICRPQIQRSSVQTSVWPKGHSSTDAEALEFFFPPLSCNAAGRGTTRPRSGPTTPSLLWIVGYLCSRSRPALCRPQIQRSLVQTAVWPKGRSSTDAEALEFFFPPLSY